MWLVFYSVLSWILLKAIGRLYYHQSNKKESDNDGDGPIVLVPNLDESF